MSKSFQVKRFVASSIAEALHMIKKELGADAVILSNETIEGKVHVIAAPGDAMEDSTGNTQHAHKTANALSRLKKSKEETSSVNPYFFNRVSNTDDRFSSVALKKSTQIENVDREDDLSYLNIKNEILSIKKMMSSHYHAQYWEQFQKENLIQAIVYKKLISIGFEAKTIESLVDQLPNDISFDEAWIFVLNGIVKKTRLYKQNKSIKKFNVMVGPAGAGKTTLFAKFLMQNIDALFQEQIAVIFINQNKLTTVHEAKAFHNIFNLPCFYVESVAELEEAIALCADKKQIFIDMPSPNMMDDTCNEYLNHFKKVSSDVNLFYVIPSCVGTTYLSSLFNLTKDMTVCALSITKIDEHPNYIPVLDFALRFDVPIAYLNLSSVMTEPLIEAHRSSLIKDLLMVVNQYALDQISIDEKMATYFMEKFNNESELQASSS